MQTSCHCVLLLAVLKLEKNDRKLGVAVQQLILGAALLIAGILLNLIYNRMQQSGGTTDILDVREVSARLKEGETGKFTVRAPLQAKHLAASPLDGKKNAYYETRILALEGKRQREIYSAASEEKPFLQDAPGGEKLWVDIPSFGERAELFPAHMETVIPDSPEAKQVEQLTKYQPGSDFRGYRLLEGCLQPGRQVYFCGEMYRKDGALIASGGFHKSNFFTYRQPDKTASPKKSSAAGKVALIIGAIAVIIGLAVILSHFLK